MNLLCPNCQKPLSVPDQYAGQPMRCPLCAGTFTVPALPQMSAAPPPPLPSAAPPPPPPLSLAAPPPEVYNLRDPAMPPPPPPPPDLDLAVLPPSAIGGAPPPPPPHYGGPPPIYKEEQPTYPATPVPEGYQRRLTAWFSPKVLVYVAPAALVLILVLSFFPWTGLYPGGVAQDTQNAWQATFGMVSPDPDIPGSTLDKDTQPGLNILLLFYVMLFVPTLLVTVACLALAFVPPSALPPFLHAVLPWRWGIVAVLNVVLLLFLGLQMVFGFSLENNALGSYEKARAQAMTLRGNTPLTTQEVRQDAMARGMVHQMVSRTIWLDLVVLLHVLAILGAGLMFWVNRRGARAAPRLDLLT